MSFTHGYAVALLATLAVAVVASAPGAIVARRAALIAIPAALALWVVIGLGMG